MYVRVSANGAGKLVRVRLAQIDPRYRAQVSRRVRERLWDQELGPGALMPPDPTTRALILLESVQIEAAANHPSRRSYRVPEDVAADVLEKHGAD
jgi:hypothetical protein